MVEDAGAGQLVSRLWKVCGRKQSQPGTEASDGKTVVCLCRMLISKYRGNGKSGGCNSCNCSPDGNEGERGWTLDPAGSPVGYLTWYLPEPR